MIMSCYVGIGKWTQILLRKSNKLFVFFLINFSVCVSVLPTYISVHHVLA